MYTTRAVLSFLFTYFFGKRSMNEHFKSELGAANSFPQSITPSFLHWQSTACAQRTSSVTSEADVAQVRSLLSFTGTGGNIRALGPTGQSPLTLS
jgi:hypothetical protein